ncbi:MAG: M56 family metallopeptidase [Acidobacteria bacterium]|nr:M56 family metallopeptidase [Acidobacteriota bacterium]
MLGIGISLAIFSAVDALASLLVLLLWRGIGNRLQSLPASFRANLFLSLRFLPVVATSLLVFAYVIPAYLIYEPRETTEKVSFKMAFLAAFSVVFLLLAACRFVSGQIATSCLVKNWLRNSEPVRDDRLRIPIYRLRHPFPVIAVTGILRRKLFIADQLFDLLSEAELTAAFAHEYAHLKARDNIKGALLHACCDFLTILPGGHALARAWIEASEIAADEDSARAGGEASLDLASALIKIARVVPENSQAAMPAGVSLIAGDSSAIALRVQRLTQMATADPRAERSVGEWSCSRLYSIIIAMVVGLAAFFPDLLSIFHEWIEVIVSAFQ